MGAFTPQKLIRAYPSSLLIICHHITAFDPVKPGPKDLQGSFSDDQEEENVMKPGKWGEKGGQLPESSSRIPIQPCELGGPRPPLSVL